MHLQELMGHGSNSPLTSLSHWSPGSAGGSAGRHARSASASAGFGGAGGAGMVRNSVITWLQLWIRQVRESTADRFAPEHVSRPKLL